MEKLLARREDSDISEATIARALYLRSLLLRADGENIEADNSEEESFKMRDALLEHHNGGLLRDIRKGNLHNPMVIFDHLVNIDQGRSTIGKLTVRGLTQDMSM